MTAAHPGRGARVRSGIVRWFRRHAEVRIGQARSQRSLVTIEHREPAARVLVVASGWPTPEDPGKYVFTKRQMDSLAPRGVRYETLYIRGHRSILAYPVAAARLFALNFLGAEYRLVHAHGGEAALAACVYRRAPLLTSYLGGDLLGNSYRPDAHLNLQARMRRWMIRQSARCAVQTITKSLEMQEALPRRRRRRNAVIPNGVDMDLFRPVDQSAARAALGWRPDESIALFVGNPAELRKRYALAVASVDQARATVANLRLALAHNIEPERVPIYMSAADCLVHVSWMEGSPNVVKEALMCNLPIISTAVGDVAELLAGVEPSFLVEPTPGSVTQALVDCLAASHRSNGRSRSGRLASDRVAAQVLTVYERLAPRAIEPGQWSQSLLAQRDRQTRDAAPELGRPGQLTEGFPLGASD